MSSSSSRRQSSAAGAPPAPPSRPPPRRAQTRPRAQARMAPPRAARHRRSPPARTPSTSTSPTPLVTPSACTRWRRFPSARVVPGLFWPVLSCPFASTRGSRTRDALRQSLSRASMYAILSHGGRQYRVSAGDRLVVDRLAAEVGSVVAREPVLLTGGDGKTALGKDLDGLRVAVTVIAHRRGEKLRIF